MLQAEIDHIEAKLVVLAFGTSVGHVGVEFLVIGSYSCRTLQGIECCFRVSGSDVGLSEKILYLGALVSTAKLGKNRNRLRVLSCSDVAEREIKFGGVPI